MLGESPFFVFLKVFFCISVFACCMTLVGGGSGDSPRSPPYHTQAASVGGTREAKLLTHKIVVFPFSYSAQFFLYLITNSTFAYCFLIFKPYFKQ